MIFNTKWHGLPYTTRMVGRFATSIRHQAHVVQVGCWTIEFTPDTHSVFAVSEYRTRRNTGHHIPAELVNGQPYYPFGIHHSVPVHVKQTIDQMVKEFGTDQN